MILTSRKNGAIQNLDDACVHDWYRFVLAYPDHLVQTVLDRFQCEPRHIVLDPFVGTGTTLVECKKQGISSIGIDSNPVAAFASKVKTTWNIDLEEFSQRTKQVIRQVRQETKEVDFDSSTAGNGTQLSFGDLNEASSELAYPVDDDFVSLIPANAFSARPLAKVLITRQVLSRQPQDSITDLMGLALASTAVHDMSNLGFGPEIYVRRQKRQDARLTTAFAKRLRDMRRDLTTVQQIEQQGDTQIYCGDARALTDIITEPIDFVITSPPYPNEKDYSRITRVELALLNFVTDRESLRELKKTMLRSHTRNIYKDDDDGRRVEDIFEIRTLADQIEQKRIERGATSGFERLYHRVVMEYFGGMHRLLEQVSHLMRPGGKIALVVGDQMSYFQVPIETARLLTLVARRLDFTQVETLTWRSRLATASKKEIDEHILILERS